MEEYQEKYRNNGGKKTGNLASVSVFPLLFHGCISKINLKKRKTTFILFEELKNEELSLDNYSKLIMIQSVYANIAS